MGDRGQAGEGVTADMAYIVIATTDETATIWDGVTRDAKHGNRPYGVMDIHVGGGHCFEVDDHVELRLRKAER